jgi:enoyl-CoA hydratase/carnithine racemase
VPTSSVTSELDGRIGRLTLNRPEAMNAITIELADGLQTALGELEGVCDVIVIRGAGGNFCVGGDFHELERLRVLGPGATAELFAAFGRACALVEELEVPVVTAVEGYAMAGGFELVQASDIAIVTSDAVLADNHSNHGQIPGGGGSARLPRLVGRQRAGAHMLSGGRLSGSEAVAWGLAYQAVEPGDFEAALEQLLERLAGMSREAQARTKLLIRRGLELPLQDALELERQTVAEHLRSDGAAAGITSFTARKGA